MCTALFRILGILSPTPLPGSAVRTPLQTARAQLIDSMRTTKITRAFAGFRGPTPAAPHRARRSPPGLLAPAQTHQRAPMRICRPRRGPVTTYAAVARNCCRAPPGVWFLFYASTTAALPFPLLAIAPLVAPLAAPLAAPPAAPPAAPLAQPHSHSPTHSPTVHTPQPHLQPHL